MNKKNKGLTGFILKRVALVLLDAIIMNGSYYLALLIRFHSCKFGTMKTALKHA